MGMLVVILILIVAVIVLGVPFAFWYLRNLREKKNYERALKLVPLLIHLPPMSEDIQTNGRDTRDLVDENTSKAQVIYNIIASTFQKNFKNKLYGQRQFSFEVVGSQGLVYFYAMVPIVLVDVVKQAIVSAYTTAQVEEVAEHNIFNRVGKINAVLGGEFVLKKSFAYPIATYQDLKRDTMQAFLNALSSLTNEDGATIQIILRATDSKWRQTAGSMASDIRKGKKNNSGLQSAAQLGRQMIQAFSQPPDDRAADKKDSKPELSNHEQAVLDSVDDKTRYQAYETLIRVVVSSNVAQRSQAILANITSSFSLFDAPGKNGFKFIPAADADTLVNNYLLRLFPQHKRSMVLNSVELATLFHFPDQRSIPTSQLQRQDSKQVDGPRNVPSDGLLLGYNVFRGAKKPIRIGFQDRSRHMYVVGQTGTGKSTFLENLALQDMLKGKGFAFVDPHGDTVERLLSMVPKERTEDIIYFSPAELAYPMGLNIFEFDTPDQKDFLIQEALNMLYKLYDPHHQGIMGPRYEHLFRNAALTVMADPEGGTFVDIPKLFRDPKFVQQKLQFVTDRNVKEFWEKEMPQSQRSNEFGDVVSWFISKFGAFLSNEMMRNIIGQTKSAFELRSVMDNKKILLVNLSKGRTGELNSKLLGMIFIMKFQSAAMSRANQPESERQDFGLYVDEFQNFSTDSFATIMSEARKYHLNLIVANQFTTQLTEEIRDAIFGNIGTTIAFRVGDRDAESLNKYFHPAFDETDLLRLPNYNTIVRTMIDGVPTQPFSMSTLPPLGTPNPRLAEALKQLSAAKYGRPKAAVEDEIFARMETKADTFRPAAITSPYDRLAGSPQWAPDPLKPSAQNHPYLSSPSSVPAQPKSGSSFLDEWLSKRQSKPPASIRKPIDHHDQAQMTKNISSSSLDKGEIDQLAAQLRHNLDETPDDKRKAEIVPDKKEISDDGDKEPLKLQDKKAVDHTTEKITKTHTGGDPDGDDADTIYIDQEGELHLKQDTKTPTKEGS
jgi:uncharacterized protein DUF87/type IV secretory system conjugative DNA transfer VirD4/TraG family protein